MSEKEAKALKERLSWEPKPVWDALSQEEKTASFELADRYKRFLFLAKTEREAVDQIVHAARAEGFRSLDEEGEERRKLYAVHKNKCVALARLGKQPLVQGFRVIAAHIDAPRLDLKQNPLYEDLDMVFLKTHYYGGIKKYQWVTRPLALHGKIVLRDGSERTVRIGEEDGDPVFLVNDLLPHLAQNAQAKKKMPDIVVGEKLNVLVGALPYPERDVEQRFKLAILETLHRTYGIVEEDFLCAEIEVVPAGPAYDVGLDRSMVGGYGQDDRGSAFPALSAVLDLADPEVTCIALFVDKEEIGSEGPASARSRFFEAFVLELFRAAGESPGIRELRRCLLASAGISADVNAAMDPDWVEVYEKRNAGRLGYGVCLSKFTGHRGKVGANDASAEFLAWLRRVFSDAGVVWHAGEIGKVDEGGGGTIAKFLAELGMDIVDLGIPVLSMHSPFEVVHKGDLYMAYRAFKAFFEA